MELQKFEFAGVEGHIDKDIKKKWKEELDGYITKDIYEHIEEGLEHKYYYAIQVIDLGEACGEEGYQVILHYVIHPQSVCERIINNIFEQFCDDDFGIEDIAWFDLMHEGCTIQLGSKHAKDEIELEKVLLGAMTSVETINALRGFWLDREWNMIGTTGWDVIKYALGIKENLFW
jgi:hypothetical protein